MIKEILDYEVEQGKIVLNNHIVPELNRESALESMLFCIANQVIRWEVPTNFILNLRKISYPGDKNATEKIMTLKTLGDKEKLNEVAKYSGLRFKHQKRFDDAL